MLNALTIIDYILAAVIIISVLAGIWRGFARELISFITWVAAFFVAFLLFETVEVILQPYIPSPAVRTILAFGGLFVIVLAIGGFINLIIRWLMKYSALSIVNRFFGAVFGLLRGGAIAVLLLLAGSLTNLPDMEVWQQSQLKPYFEPVVEELKLALPEVEMETELPSATTDEEPTTASPEDAPVTDSEPVEADSGETNSPASDQQ